ncbi:3-isopropylmalate dehydratase small subunit [Enterovibrio norvegicus]|uniref:3-isopropylmalate dehydratase small subunit n=1 Tax=Enterovibrio norvegicus TaxID=188144 RepID=UPI000C821A19|nr:3-isopropylmalate dehydratase small subunit [Enterovibrio norvegicus]PMN68563.1 3-isopropylmalate dehydratase small subunit [Enterovibrio norvegicus]
MNIKGQTAPLPMANVDTDVIMPKRFLITITREGLADGAFADLRFDDNGARRPEFVLNKPEWKNASILIVGDNFGCGSSREHAVWGMMQLGVKAIIGTEFAGIFYDNARKNGLALPMVTAEERDKLIELASNSEGYDIEIDVASLKIIGENVDVDFTMDPATQRGLIEGRDDTLDTLKLVSDIQAYEAKLNDNQHVSVQQ